MKFGVLQFPGTCDEVDALYAARRVGDAELLWHGERDLKGVDAIVVPGGFSYGDYLRAGAIARFSPVMESVVSFARDGGLVLGICNGFQVLCEARLLPGALLPNVNLRFTFRQVDLEVVEGETAFTCACAASEDVIAGGEPMTCGALMTDGEPMTDGGSRVGGHLTLSIPAKHSWGRYYADEPTLAAIEQNGQVVLRYAPGENFNGSTLDIAGVRNEQGNVFGLMPHPEHAVDELSGSTDGLCIFASMRLAVEGAHV
jgi:phosphoribosylformylglycinamidine (FGAM) synthase-like amidotransferase family enzyme